MNETSPPPEIDEDEVDERTLRREQQFGGQLRWFYTFCAVLSARCGLGLAKTHPFMAVSAVGFMIIFIFWARTNWRNWQKKSEAEKAPLLFLPKLEIRPVSIPCTREDFTHNEHATVTNMLLTIGGAIFSIGLAMIFRPQIPIGTRLEFFTMGAVSAWVFWNCGRKFLRGQKALTCPGCKDVIWSQKIHVLKTGTCRKCGRQVLVD